MPPEWMQAESLEDFVSRERSSRELTNLPIHYMEIAQLLITHAKEDIPNVKRVSILLQDLENIRMVSRCLILDSR